MVKDRNYGYLTHILKHCNKVIEKTNLLTKEEYDNNEDYCDLICFHILQIGELVKHLDFSFVSTHDQVPWGDIARMRDKIAHGYESIELDKVWNIGVYDVPTLKKYCESILNSKE